MKSYINDNNYTEEKYLILHTYYMELNYNKKKLQLLNRHKPFFFEINKLKKHYKEKSEIENKIRQCENKIAKLIDSNE